MQPTPSSRTGTFITSEDGGRLAYAVAGHGEPVVFLHGFGLDSSMWDAQWAAVSNSFRAIRYDLRGFGASSLPVGPYSHVADFLALTDQLEARPMHLVGLSHGARLALRVALEAPTAVRTLTLADSALDGYRWSEPYAQSWRAMNSMGRTDVAKAKQHWLEHELFTTARSRAWTARALSAMVGRYSGWHFRNADPEIGPKVTVLDQLSTITAPTLIIVGEADMPDFQTIARLLATKIPGASLQTLPGVGHVSNLEDPDAFNQHLLAHLRQAAAADRMRP